MSMHDGVFCWHGMPAIWIDVQRQRSISAPFHSNNSDYILEKVVRHNLFTLEAWNESFESLEMGLQAWALFSTWGERQYKWPGAMAFGSWSWILISLMPLLFFLPITHTYKRRLTDRSEHLQNPSDVYEHHMHRSLWKVTLSIIWKVSSVRTIQVSHFHALRPAGTPISTA